MKALILIAHGSRRVESNDEIRSLIEIIKGKLAVDYQFITTAFLELADPSIETAIDLAVEAGADEILLFPYFLAAGKHLQIHIPEIVERKQQQYSSIQMTLKDHIGKIPGMAELLIKTLQI